VGAHAVRLAGSLYGRQVLVIGAGPIGLAVTLFARFAGARSVCVSELDPARRQRATKLGATSVIDPNNEPVSAALARTGDAPDLIFECVGAPGLIRACMDLLPIHGCLVVVGVNRGEDTILPRVAIRKELTIKFALGYQREDFSLVLDLMADGRIDADALVSRVIGFAELPDMFERLRRPNPDAKVLIDPSR
jgi:(R,R)-butanediol dehydrogenase/meso-butanediol dehydrogenase/diacetyl reductase